MSNFDHDAPDSNLIDEPLSALRRVRDVLTSNRIQISAVGEMTHSKLGEKNAARITLTLAVPLDEDKARSV